MPSSHDLIHLNKLFNDFFENFVRFATTYLNNRTVAEDFVMEAFTAYWEKHADLEPDTVPQAYILTIVRNKCLNHLKHLAVRQTVEEKLIEHYRWKLDLQIATLEACNPVELFSAEVQQIIRDTLSQLPERTRQVFSMSKTENRSHKEIADAMGISVKGVEYHLSKAIKALRNSLKNYLSISSFLLVEQFVSYILR